MNSITLDGSVFQAETRYSKNGVAVLTFNLSAYLGKEADKKTSRYGNIRVKAFKALAENAGRELTDKDHVVVTGRLDFEKWEKDGQKYSRPCIIATDIAKSISRFDGGGQAVDDSQIPY